MKDQLNDKEPLTIADYEKYLNRELTDAEKSLLFGHPTTTSKSEAIKAMSEVPLPDGAEYWPTEQIKKVSATDSNGLDEQIAEILDPICPPTRVRQGIVDEIKALISNAVVETEKNTLLLHKFYICDALEVQKTPIRLTQRLYLALDVIDNRLATLNVNTKGSKDV